LDGTAVVAILANWIADFPVDNDVIAAGCRQSITMDSKLSKFILLIFWGVFRNLIKYCIS
ncbi:hypothetical protein, partial [Cysteiniphilum sp. SYW-8]|uniref:hypothetical protein n=1 Tax=Cysteiniphilum sp. SYW-8 TaxID=2610890 RepID=UPI001CD16B91